MTDNPLNFTVAKWIIVNILINKTISNITSHIAYYVQYYLANLFLCIKLFLFPFYSLQKLNMHQQRPKKPTKIITA